MVLLPASSKAAAETLTRYLAYRLKDEDFRINGERVDPEYGWVMTHQFNMLHNCPVLAVPSGFAKTGVPTGMQIVGKTWDDVSVFRAGLAYEKAVGGWYTKPTTRPRL